MPARNPSALTSQVLLQVDLEGHTRFMAAQPSKYGAATTRIGIAEQLHSALAKHDFKLLSWKGDGGVYSANPADGRGPLDFAIRAARAAADAFDRWRRSHEERAALRLRISLHWAPDVYVHKRPGYWSSDHLNLFMKYEREVSLSGTIAVTDALFQHLSPKCQRQFVAPRRCVLSVSPGKVLVEQVYYWPLQKEVELNRTARGGFFEWISSLGAIPFNRADTEIGPTALSRGTLGDAAFLFAAPMPDSPITIDFRPTASTLELQLSPELQVEWDRLRLQELERCRQQMREDGRKVSPFRLVRPLSDIPLATLEWRTDSWSRVRTFHELLTKYPKLRKQLGHNALAIMEDGVSFPGIAGCHFVLRTSAVSGPRVLVCQRQTKGPTDMYEPGRWSISFEEQLKPDEGITDCVHRGLREELLASTGSVGATARLLAAILEKRFLNLSFIVVVDVPLTLGQITDSWRNAIDKDEHRQLATLPLTRDVLRQLALTQTLSPSVRSMMEPSHPDTFAATDCWDLHPTSVARTAVALWAQEAGPKNTPPNPS